MLGGFVTNISHELNQPQMAIEIYSGAGQIENHRLNGGADKIRDILGKINKQLVRVGGGNKLHKINGYLL